MKHTFSTSRHRSAKVQIKVAHNTTLRHVAEARQTYHRKGSKGITQALLGRLLDFAGHEVAVDELTTRFCTRFAKYLLGRVAVGSARTYLQKLHAVLEVCVEHRLLAANPMPPMANLIRTVDWRERTYLTADEVRLLAEAECPSESTRQAFLFACYTGLRLSDVETLRWEHIHVVEGRHIVAKRQSKTGREVRVPLIGHAYDILAGMGWRHRGAVFSLRSRSSIGTDLRAWGQSAGLAKRLTFHVSRHTFATMLVSGNVDIYTVSRLCGHSNVHITERYAHVTDRRLIEGMLAMEVALT